MTTSTRSPTGCAQANIRWGFDKEHRAPYGLDHFVHNTWRFGLDRILTGVAMSDDSQAWLDTTLPLDDVGSNKVELAGRLAEFVDRLRTRGRLARRHTTVERVAGRADRRRRRCSPASTTTTPGRPAQLQREFADVLEQAGSRAVDAAAAARHPRAAGRAPGRTPDSGQLPHRHADGVHDGADALGAAPGGVPGRPRRRRVPAAQRRRRRRRAGARPDDRRTRHPFRGPATAARRRSARPPRRW